MPKGTPGAGGGATDTKGCLAPLEDACNHNDFALEYMRTHSEVDAQLVLGTEAFDGGQLPLDLGALSLG